MTNYSLDDLRNLEQTITPAQIETLLKVADAIHARAGLIMWWPNSTGTIPNGYLLCNGQAVNRTEFSYLFSAIGTKYGAGDGSSTFNVPNLISTAEDSSGNFIRATATDSEVGLKTKDEIRRIRGRYGAGKIRDTESDVYAGAISPATQEYYGDSATGTSGQNFPTFKFDSNQDYDQVPSGASNPSSYTNPMAGHGAGTDIHPYNIKLVPVIATGNL